MKLEQLDLTHIVAYFFNGFVSNFFAKWNPPSQFYCMNQLNEDTVKPVYNSHSKIDKTKILMTNGSFMKVESIAECSP